MYISRILENTVKDYLSIFPVIGITGPRQSGKSTMLKNLLGESYKYVTFDDFKMVSLFNDDPERFMRIYSDRVIFDEVQKVPDIFNYIKFAVDNDRDNYGKFILTGSSQFTVMKSISESLAGRIGLLSLLPFQFAEVPDELKGDSVFKGGYPEIVKRGYRFSNEWISSYLDTYINRDVRMLSNIGNISDFRKFVQILATRTAQILNMSELSRELGIAVPTVKSWISVLEASYIIFLLPPYYNNLGKRIIKSPKLYFYDTGLVSYLTGIETRELFEKGVMYGSIFENYVVSEVLKKIRHNKENAELYYYRTNHGVEIDLIVDFKTHQEFLEIKATESYRPRMTTNIEKLADNNASSVFLYNGPTMELDEKLAIMNYSDYLSR